ncbi:hypothetical protein MOQ_009532 [Trypanosoma cruzi marinkellei]|uniref:Uncharacterized protein n=1 Tax=Trypanosoma cruzi marinkellei TaxID=85056 RepID=K2NCI9_TRYCR|nr:hypothetical protein MOQ_009532 [Trypanosoma cruzi marinkellei]
MPQQSYGGQYTQDPNCHGGNVGVDPYYKDQSTKLFTGRTRDVQNSQGGFRSGGNYDISTCGLSNKNNETQQYGGLAENEVFGSYGMNSMGGFDGAIGGGSMYFVDEPPPVVYKIFSSRRDRSDVTPQNNFNRYPSQFSIQLGSYGSADNGGANYVREKRQFLPVDSSGISREPEVVKTCEPNIVPKEFNEDIQPRRPLSPVGYGGYPNDADFGDQISTRPFTSKDEENGQEEKAKEIWGYSSISTGLNIRRGHPRSSLKDSRMKDDVKGDVSGEQGEKEEENKQLEKDVSNSIPLSHSIGATSHNPPCVGSTFGGNETSNPLGSSAVPVPDQTLGGNNLESHDEQRQKPRSRSIRGSMRRRPSLGAARSASAVNMSIAVFPEADELQDGLAMDILAHRRPSGSQLQLNAFRRSQFTAIEDPKQGEHREHRERSKVAEEPVRPQLLPKKSKETLQEEQKRLDEEERKKNEEERLRRKSEERKRFEEEKKREEQREEERIRQLVGNTESSVSAEPKTKLVGRASSRSRPTSRRGSLLRSIPEQPPELEVGTMQDTMADTLPLSSEHSAQRLSTRAAGQDRRGSDGRPWREHGGMERGRDDELQRSTSHDSEKQRQRGEEEVQQEGQQNDSKEQRKANPIKTLLLLERSYQGPNSVSAEGNTFIYHWKRQEATEVVLRDLNSMSYRSNLFNDVRDAVCDSHNAAILSVEAPSTGTLFNSPVWSGLIRIVSGILRNNRIMREGTAELTAAFGFVYKDKVRDLFDGNGSSFEPLVVHPSPIYGPRIPHLHYGKITSDSAFEEVMSSALRRANADPILTTRDGVAIAFLLSRQCRIVKNEAGEKTCDVSLSSLVVASAGSDPVPFESALARLKNEHSMLFHLVLGGPCHTCFMLNLSMVEEKDNVNREKVEKLIELQGKMHASSNYPLRSGSVTRFVRYVESANKEALERLKVEENPERRKRLERYVQEQEQLLADANKMLAEVQEELLQKFFKSS